jgi:hypothetical protein
LRRRWCFAHSPPAATPARADIITMADIARRCGSMLAQKIIPRKLEEERMAIDKGAAAKIVAQIDRDELARLGCDLTSIPSPTG